MSGSHKGEESTVSTFPTNTGLRPFSADISAFTRCDLNALPLLWWEVAFTVQRHSITQAVFYRNQSRYTREINFLI